MKVGKRLRIAEFLNSPVWNTLKEVALQDPGKLGPALKEAYEACTKEGLEELSGLLSALVSLVDSPEIIVPSCPPKGPFPEVLEVLRLLGDVAKAFASYQMVSEEAARRNYLDEAFSVLARVQQMIAESSNVPQPFAAILAFIVERWHQILVAERDRWLASRFYRSLAPLEDFYVIGPPLGPTVGRLFVGREKIFRTIVGLFQHPHQMPVVLCGQPRMGKTSILKHMGAKLGSHYIPVLVDLRGLFSDPFRPVYGDKAVWQALMREIGKALNMPYRGEESAEEFLERVAPVRGNRLIVLMLDDFEKLENATTTFPDALLGLMQRRPELRVILSGRYPLWERPRQYWASLLGCVRSVLVSYLDEGAAFSLITNPWDGFRLRYTGRAIYYLMRATGCQPQLLQLACSATIQEVNEVMKRKGYVPYPMGTEEVVRRALGRLLEENGGYFDAVWEWLPEEQRETLILLADLPEPGSGGWLSLKRGIKGKNLVALEEREILEIRGNLYRFRVELFNLWIARRFRGLRFEGWI